jgi:hypothetical protein
MRHVRRTIRGLRKLLIRENSTTYNVECQRNKTNMNRNEVLEEVGARQKQENKENY